MIFFFCGVKKKEQKCTILNSGNSQSSVEAYEKTNASVSNDL